MSAGNIETTINHIKVGAEEVGEDAATGGGWLSAVAKAMGNAMGQQAARVVALSNAISENASARTGDTEKDAKLAAEGQALNAQFSAASQELSYTSNSFSTALKALGEASTTLARKS